MSSIQTYGLPLIFARKKAYICDVVFEVSSPQHVQGPCTRTSLSTPRVRIIRLKLCNEITYLLSYMSPRSWRTKTTKLIVELKSHRSYATANGLQIIQPHFRQCFARQDSFDDRRSISRRHRIFRADQLRESCKDPISSNVRRIVHNQVQRPNSLSIPTEIL
jgi:hypothetical protein